MSDPAYLSTLIAAIRRREFNPLRAVRLLALVHVAAAEAAAWPQPSPAAAAAAAEVGAAHVLGRLLPAEALQDLLPRALARAPARWDPRALQRVLPVLVRSLSDGADARRRPLAKPAPAPGIWQRTPPLFAEQPAEPQAPGWRPWCEASRELAVPPPVPHGSARWREELDEVLAVARALTPVQREIAHRWHLDAGSITPPGLWNRIAADHQQAHPEPRPRAARALALMNIAMHDALVACWRVKLTHWTERPATALVRERDPGFVPLLVTPPFPGYVSGHACASGAAAAVLAHFYPAHRASWSALAEEAAMSRLYGGIHFRSDNDEGLLLGRRVAEACLRQFEPAGATPRPLITEAEDGWADFFGLPRIAGSG